MKRSEVVAEVVGMLTQLGKMCRNDEQHNDADITILCREVLAWRSWYASRTDVIVDQPGKVGGVLECIKATDTSGALTRNQVLWDENFND